MSNSCVMEAICASITDGSKYPRAPVNDLGLGDSFSE